MLPVAVENIIGDYKNRMEHFEKFKHVLGEIKNITHETCHFPTGCCTYIEVLPYGTMKTSYNLAGNMTYVGLADDTMDIMKFTKYYYRF